MYMKLFFILFVTLISGVSFSQKGVVHVNSNSFTNLIELGNTQILDVRTEQENKEGSIKGSVNIDFWHPEFITLVKNQFDKSEPLLIYCAGGGRSGMAADKLSKKGFKVIYDLEGGYDGYTNKD